MNTLSSIIGHPHATSYLSSLIEDRDSPDFFPTSLFFRGPSGVGKHTTALAFASALQCPQKGLCDPVCPSCTQVKEGVHPDVHCFGPETKGGTLKIAEVRGLLEEASHQTAAGLFNVFVIEHAHTITPEGADALLKTVEDGTGDSLFIFTSDHPQWVIRTLRSRSISLPFGPLDRDDLRTVLESQSADLLEHPKCDVGLHLARGSVERALFFLDPEQSGFQVRKKALGFLRGILKGIPEYKILDFLKDRVSEDERWEFLGLICTALRDMLFLSEHAESALVNLDQKDFLKGLLEMDHVEPDRLCAGFEVLVDLFNRRHLPIQGAHAIQASILEFQTATLS